MQWEEDRRSSMVGHLLIADSDLQPMSLQSAIEAFAQGVEKHIIGERSGPAAAALRIELWSDSGRIIVGEEMGANHAMSDEVRCAIQLPDLAAQWSSLAESDLDDVDFCRQLEDVERPYLGALVAALSSRHRHGHSLSLCVHVAGADEPVAVHRLGAS